MRAALILLGFCSAIFLASCGSAPRAGEERSAARKSPVVGELLAIFPGIFVHGMGHRYAGNADKADEILVMELYSLIPIALGGALWGIGENQDAEAVRVAGWIGMGIGAVPFLGTWVYDLVYTPSEVGRYNAALEGKP
jgi:hypothetical protein